MLWKCTGWKQSKLCYDVQTNNVIPCAFYRPHLQWAIHGFRSEGFGMDGWGGFHYKWFYHWMAYLDRKSKLGMGTNCKNVCSLNDPSQLCYVGITNKKSIHSFNTVSLYVIIWGMCLGSVLWEPQRSRNFVKIIHRRIQSTCIHTYEDVKSIHWCSSVIFSGCNFNTADHGPPAIRRQRYALTVLQK